MRADRADAVPIDTALPQAPREPHLRTVLRRRWVLGLIGAVLVVSAAPILIVLAVIGIDLTPLTDDALDAEAERAFGVIESVTPSSLHVGELRYDRVEFRFEPGDGGAVHGATLAPRGRYQAGDRATIDFLPYDAQRNRLHGERRSPTGPMIPVLVGSILLPGIACLLLWLRGILRLRVTLRQGRAATARIVEARALRWVNPPQLRVTYEFDLGAGVRAQGRHCVGCRTPLGRAIDGGLDRVPVVFDDACPESSRLVTAADFA